MAGMTGVYNFTSDVFRVTADMKKNFDDKGYILVRGMFDGKEMANLRKVFEETDLITDHGLQVGDGTGKKTKIALWTHPGSDVSGMMARCEKVVNTCEDLLGKGEVYHYHGKLLYKDAFTGGAHLWHQDYGYWYRNTCLFPDLMTVFVAIDKCAKSNGCLQILPGSQKCGRIDHEMVAGQMTAKAERVAAIKNVCPLEYVEMEAGDALFFHSNLLHCSSANDSPDRRWAYLIAYNTRANNPLVPHHHAQYTPIQKVPDRAVAECTNYTDFTDKEFLEGHESKTSNFDKKET
ncbi:probable phytanoyl-CoA dioxygenase [Mizuhopecten yessoensis]|uniref:Phytanoyl-CoA dioxygenase n=1 Tax=Mizuhopecten yessoensis TaxID=6573 RepID=A0A210QAQ3_MIZYE|nr:probable phytanoyl-CoA dioxygenase [Mizuhopecten yessoensis]XP_021363001.1 probable phytanoyl-CoA dioxygenase [Mizuhopecten yessoensis]XP_021363002.1 probable phytanoyl-CoA dioxygenase [Mizuhopecten yessoensis]XP_021363003.1 probable phytanoyl-CoA dioxygenase [Mizuhopecten yessoensis]OWF45812.1 phytanoyl-CoA dioxygenase [Mizuhopecten yessoensis]